MIYQMADTALNPKLRDRARPSAARRRCIYGGLRGAALESAGALTCSALIELEPDAHIDRLPSELSGGQKQRIGIARALAAEPRFIICDEVTSALDQLVAEGILRLLDRLQSEFDLAYMFITHDLATVRAIADEVVVMQHGRVVEHGPKQAMFTPAAPSLYRASALLGAGNGPGLALSGAGRARCRQCRRSGGRLIWAGLSVPRPVGRGTTPHITPWAVTIMVPTRRAYMTTSPGRLPRRARISYSRISWSLVNMLPNPS